MAPLPSEGLIEVARACRADLDGLIELVLDAIVAELPILTVDPAVAKMLEVTVRDTVTAGLAVLAGERGIEAVTAPEISLQIARKLAQQNVPLPVLLRAYRLGQAAFQQELVARIMVSQISREAVTTAARELSSATFSFVDQVAEEVVGAYQDERDSWLQRRNAARLARIASVLNAHGPHTAVDQGLEQALGYPLATTHLGCVLWSGPGGDAGPLERRATDIATVLGCPRPPLVVFVDSSSVWAWFPAPQHSVDHVRADMLGVDTFAAFGEPASGIDGFRRTHQQARQCYVVAGLPSAAEQRPIVTAEQLGPLLLVALEPSALGTWVQSVLGDLAADDEDTARLRETLWTYLAADGNLSAAAHALHLHRNTVQYRLVKAARVRGRPWAQDRLAVEVALHAVQVLGTVVLGAVSSGG